jgi:hypothetical protein
LGVYSKEAPLFFDAKNILALIAAAGRASAMRLLWFIALWAERDAGGFQAIVGAAHITLGFRGFFLRYCHCLNVSLAPGYPAFIIDVRGYYYRAGIEPFDTHYIAWSSQEFLQVHHCLALNFFRVANPS